MDQAGDDRRPNEIAAYVCGSSLALSAVIARIASRIRAKNTFGPDDWTMFIAAVRGSSQTFAVLDRHTDTSRLWLCVIITQWIPRFYQDECSFSALNFLGVGPSGWFIMDRGSVHKMRGLSPWRESPFLCSEEPVQIGTEASVLPPARAFGNQSRFA